LNNTGSFGGQVVEEQATRLRLLRDAMGTAMIEVHKGPTAAVFFVGYTSTKELAQLRNRAGTQTVWIKLFYGP
jgi:hypothetical protein